LQINPENLTFFSTWPFSGQQLFVTFSHEDWLQRTAVTLRFVTQFHQLSSVTCKTLWDKAMVLKLCVAATLVRRFNFPRASHKSKLSAVLFIELINVKFSAVL